MLKSFYKVSATAFALLALPVMIVSAQGTTGAAPTIDTGAGVTTYLGSITTFINNVIIPFLLGLGFLVFVFGMFQYFIAGGADEEKRAKGKDLIIYAVLGFVLIFIFWGLVNLATRFTGITGSTPTNFPDAPGPATGATP